MPNVRAVCRRIPLPTAFRTSPHENDIHHGGSDADRWNQFGARRRVGTAVRKQTNRPAATRSQHSGREVVQVRVDFDPGYVSPRHTHFGDEIIYVIEGTLEYQVEGKPTATYKAGDVLLVPSGAIQAAKNVGTVNAAELATYVVEKDKPLITLVK